MTGRSFTLDGYGARVRVGVPWHFPPADLVRHVAPEVQVEEGAAGQLDLLLTCWNGTFHLVYGERRYGPYSNLTGALRGLGNAVHFVLGKRSPLTFLHAGAVEIDGHAVVFPGRSRWGKSSLVASLVERGCGYMSDEYAVISEHGTVFPLSKPIRLRGEPGGTYVHPPGVSAPGGLVCSTLILTRFEEGSQWVPKSVSAGEAILDTLPSALQSRECPERVLTSLSSLVAEASCYRSSRADLAPTADAIIELVEGSRIGTREASL